MERPTKSRGFPMSPASFRDMGRRTLPGPRRCQRLSNAWAKCSHPLGPGLRLVKRKSP